MIVDKEVREQKAAYPSFYRRGDPPDDRKEGETMVTYSDLIQFCIFVITLVGLCYTIFRDRK
nr:MAG TPA: Putative Holin-like Toxin (Hol-Tox) [Bacteriophage sp.]